MGVKEEITELRRTIEAHNRSYYDLDAPTVSDFEYDALMRRLKELEKENPDVVKMVLDSGSEVGAHSLYHETVGDELFPIPGVKPLLPEEVPFRVKKEPWRALRVGRTQSNISIPRLIPSSKSSGVPTPIK